MQIAQICYTLVASRLARKILLATSFIRVLLTALASTLAPTLSSFFIAANIGLDQTGIFAIATNIAVCVYMPYRAVGAIAQPKISQAMKDGNMHEIGTLTKQVSSNQLLVGMLVLCLFWINIDLIFEILPNGQTFAVAKYVVLILSCSQLILSAFNISLPVINFSKHYYFSLIYSFVLTISIIIFNNMLVPSLGMIGSALANLISYTIYVAGLTLTAFIITKTHPISRNHAIIILIFTGILIANILWQHSCFTFFNNHLTWQPLWIHILDGILKTGLIFSITIVVIYYLNISPWINEIIRRFLPMRKR